MTQQQRSNRKRRRRWRHASLGRGRGEFEVRTAAFSSAIGPPAEPRTKECGGRGRTASRDPWVSTGRVASRSGGAAARGDYLCRRAGLRRMRGGRQPTASSSGRPFGTHAGGMTLRGRRRHHSGRVPNGRPTPGPRAVGLGSGSRHIARADRFAGRSHTKKASKRSTRRQRRGWPRSVNFFLY